MSKYTYLKPPASLTLMMDVPRISILFFFSMFYIYFFTLCNKFSKNKK